MKGKSNNSFTFLILMAIALCILEPIVYAHFKDKSIDDTIHQTAVNVGIFVLVLFATKK